MKTFKFKTVYGDTYLVRLNMYKYTQNNTLAIEVQYYDEDSNMWMSFQMLTVNLTHGCAGGNKVYIDVNNFGGAEMLIEETGIGESTGIIEQSGFCVYPLYSINMDRLREIAFENKYDGE